MCGRGSGFCLLGVGPLLLFSEGVSRLLVRVNLGLLPTSSASGSSSQSLLPVPTPSPPSPPSDSLSPSFPK